MPWRWFKKFGNGDFSSMDEKWIRRHSKFAESLKILAKNSPAITVRELAQELGVSHMTVQCHLRKAITLRKWVPHQLSPTQLKHHIDVCMPLHSCHLQAPFLNQIVTRDEKCVQYEVAKCHQWLSRGAKAVPKAKAGLHPRKALLCVWWDVQGIIHFELLGMNETIITKANCQQL